MMETKHMRVAHRHRGAPAFSVIELLVVVGIIALLLAIALPAMASVRRSAQESKSLANLRSIAQTTGLYINTHGTHPYGRSGLVFPDRPQDAWGITVTHWMMDRHWPILFTRLAPWEEHAQAWLSPGAEDRFEPLFTGKIGLTSAPLTSYSYSTAFTAAPRLWRPGVSSDDFERLKRPTRPDEVAQPALKVMFFDHERAYLRGRERGQARPALFADFSAALVRDEDATEPVQNPDNTQVAPRRYLDTPNGIAGIDFQRR